MTFVLLMSAAFAFATGAYVFGGLLQPMAADFGTSIATVGQLQTAFALAAAVGGPVLAGLTVGWDRKMLLVTVLVFLGLTNAVSALADDFAFLFVIRVAAGLIGALTLPLASTIAVLLASPQRRAGALATVFAGNSVAFLIGIPLGSMIGAAYGWPASFWLAAVLCLVVALLIAVFVPATSGTPRPSPGAVKTVLRWPVTGLLMLSFLCFAATFTTVAYIGPIITRITGFTGDGIGMMQILIGIGSLAGLAIGARLAGAGGRGTLPRLLVIIAVTQALYVPAMVIDLGFGGTVLFGVAITAGATALFATSPIVQNRLAIATGPAATVAFAFNGSMIFLGQGTGAALGGLAAGATGLATVGVVGAGVALCGLFLATRDLSAKAAAVRA